MIRMLNQVTKINTWRGIINTSIFNKLIEMTGKLIPTFPTF
jgi:hypothetical protein